MVDPIAPRPMDDLAEWVHALAQRVAAVALQRNSTTLITKAHRTAATVYAAAGRIEDAIAAAGSVDVVGERLEALANVVRTCAEAGRHEHIARALRAFESADKQRTKAGLRGRYARTKAIAWSGQRAEAEALVRKLEGTTWRFNAWNELVKATAASGDLDHAWQLANAPEHPAPHVDGLRSELLYYLVSRGQRADALRLAHSLPGDEPASSLQTIARATATVGPEQVLERSLHLCARICGPDAPKARPDEEPLAKARLLAAAIADMMERASLDQMHELLTLVSDLAHLCIGSRIR